MPPFINLFQFNNTPINRSVEQAKTLCSHHSTIIQCKHALRSGFVNSAGKVTKDHFVLFFSVCLILVLVLFFFEMAGLRPENVNCFDPTGYSVLILTSLFVSSNF